jgi:hypothetical protein
LSFDPGDLWRPILEVRNNGTLTDATVTVSVTSPSGDVTNPSTTRSSLGTYTADVPLDEVGQWTAAWTVAGTVTGFEEQSVYVRRLGSKVVSVTDVRDRLNKSLTVDDDEIDAMIDAAIAEYETYVGPVSGSVTEKFDGGTGWLLLGSPNVSALTEAVYSDGTVIDVADLDLDTRTGIVRWGYNTAGVFTYGSRNVTVTYTVGALPANHRETIIADVAGYFAATQRGPAGLPGEGYEAGYAANPLVMFPRIRALAAPSLA